MASFAAQLKDKFLSVVGQITGWANGGAGVGKDTLPEEAAKFHIVQVQLIIFGNFAAGLSVLVRSPLRSVQEVARNPTWEMVMKQGPIDTACP